MRPVHRSLAVPTLVALCALFTAPKTLAQSNPNRDAVALYQQGLSALEQNKWQEACSLFHASLALANRPSVLVRVGACYINDKQYLQAWTTLQAARNLNNEDPAGRRPELNEEIVTYLAKVPTLQVSLSPKPADATVTIDGKALTFDEIGVALPMELGDHAVTAEAPGYLQVETNVKISREQAYLVPAPMRRVSTVSGPPEPPRPPEPPKPPKPADSSDRKTAAYVVGGAGILTLGAAAALGVMTLSRVSESNPHCKYPDGSCDSTGVTLRNEATGLQTTGLIVGGVGVLALATGVFLLVTTPTFERTAAAETPRLSGLGIGCGGTW